jgi:fructuronate reductase
MKLRLLNGSHSAMAYLGCLGGFEHVHEVIADEVMTGFIRGLMDEEISPTLRQPQGIDLAEYKDELFARFANSVLAHRLSQIAEDGSQKLPPRLIEPLRHRISGGQAYDRIALVVAAWIAYAAINPTGSTLKDPLADRLGAICASHAGDAEALVAGFLDIESVFGSDLGADRTLRATLSGWLDRLLGSDVRSLLRELA